VRSYARAGVRPARRGRS